MHTKKLSKPVSSVYATPVFRWSCLLSLLLFVSKAYAQRLGSFLWILYGYAQIILILTFLSILIYDVFFSIKRRKVYRQAYMPLLVMIATAVLIIILPLNYMRNRIDFFVNRAAYNDAAWLAVSGQLKKTNNLYELPGKYADLSVLNGDVDLLNKPGLKAVKFYTFTGIPDGQMGFVYVHQGKPADAINWLFNLVDKKVDLGDGWFYVAGE